MIETEQVRIQNLDWALLEEYGFNVPPEGMRSKSLWAKAKAIMFLDAAQNIVRNPMWTTLHSYVLLEIAFETPLTCSSGTSCISISNSNAKQVPMYILHKLTYAQMTIFKANRILHLSLGGEIGAP